MTRIPRSTQATRAHGTVRARRPVGELQGPPPAVAHQVRVIVVQVEQLPDGQWRLTQPRAPGWARAVRSPVELAAALRHGFTEAQIAAHSDWRGHVYDAAIPTYRRARPTSRSRRRCDVYDPTEWKLADDGRWISPRGHCYPEDRDAVQKVMSARQSMGLSARPDPIPDHGNEQRHLTRVTPLVASAGPATHTVAPPEALRVGQMLVTRHRLGGRAAQ